MDFFLRWHKVNECAYWGGSNEKALSPKVTLAGLLRPLSNLIIKVLGNSYTNIITGGSGHEMHGFMLGT